MLLSQNLWLWGRDSSDLFSPMVTNREFRALVLKVVQGPETATKKTSQPVVLPRERQEQHRVELLEEGGKHVRTGIKTVYILEELMEIV